MDNEVEKLKSLYEKASKYDDANALSLSYKVQTYCEILSMLGNQISQCTYIYGQSYAKRKANHGYVLEHHIGTQKEKEGRAEQKIYKLRLNEARAEEELTRAKYSFIATQEMIQAMKTTIKLLQGIGG